MKIIEAMKRVKANKEKVADLQTKLGQICANLSHETPLYGSETGTKVKEWLQSCCDLSQENATLLCNIQRTNLATNVAIELGGKSITKKLPNGSGGGVNMRKSISIPIPNSRIAA